MTVDLQRYQKLIATVERLRRDRDRAEGACDQLMARLKKEHGCDTLEKADGKAKRLEERAKEAEREFEKSLGEFEAEWGHVLEKDS